MRHAIVGGNFTPIGELRVVVKGLKEKCNILKKFTFVMKNAIYKPKIIRA
jgi:hypothetical protein